MTLKFNRVHAVVKEHVHAKFHRAVCSGSWVILRTKKKTWSVASILQTVKVHEHNLIRINSHEVK